MASYVALGRTRYDEPLRKLGELEVEPEQAAAAAREQYAGELIELTLVPMDAAVWVFREEEAHA